jgi:NADH-quinone oxidoreductase subunit N
MTPGFYSELLLAAVPELLLVVTALAVLVADATALRDLAPRTRSLLCAMIGCVGAGIAAVWTIALQQDANLLNGLLISDSLVRVINVALLVMTVFTLLISVDHRFTRHAGEYVALVLLATTGMMFLVSTEELLMLFVSLELTSLSLYILTGFDKGSRASAEAALKYFLFGGMSAAVTLFGFSLLYGVTGSTNMGVMAEALGKHASDPLVLVAMVMSIAGFGFKVAAAPFHLWAPDAYQAAPLPSAALIASGSKVASFFILLKLLLIGFNGAEGSGAWRMGVAGWMPAVAALAVLSMILGNLAALAQGNVRRLLAYSAIAHAGYTLLGIAADSSEGVRATVFYVITYALTTIGAFGVVGAVQGETGQGNLADFAGLRRRSLLLAWCMMIFLLSLAGIPPLAGFFGKFYLFAAALEGGGGSLGLLWLVVLAVAMSAVSLYYYLMVLKQIFVTPAAEDAPLVAVSPLLKIVLAVLALAVVLLGCAPAWLLSHIQGFAAGSGL